MPPESTATDIVGLWPGTSYKVAVSALRGREEGPAAVIVARTGQGLTQPLGFPPPVPFQTPRPPSPTSASPQNSGLPLQSPLSPEPLPSPIPLPPDVAFELPPPHLSGPHGLFCGPDSNTFFLVRRPHCLLMLP